jgi:16S rRNA (uracil1498-N3)-methyltransferase
VLVDGSGSQYEGQVEALSRNESRISITRRLDSPPLARPRLVLIYGLARRTRTEWVLQKATELGADWILPVTCERSVARIVHPERRLERWLEILRQSSRQSGRATVPLLSPPMPLPSALEEVSTSDLRVLADTSGSPLSELEQELAAATGSVVLAVGPEGGFTEPEVEQAVSSGFRPASLGSMTLRTETAAVALLALVAYLCGRLQHTCSST